ncbi:MAG: hypothetical protein D6808_07975, partial [Candidatus Dadabacteria bacterium]
MKLLSFANFTALFLVVSLLMGQFNHFADDPGVGWHLENGRYIVENKSVPSIDPFLYSPKPRRWIANQWASDVILYRIYKAGSWPALYGVFGALYVFTYLLVLFGSVKKISGSVVPSVIGTVMAFKMGEIHFILRPVMISFLLFTLLFFRLAELYRRGDLPKVDWYVVALFALWVNLHPSFAYGLCFVALYCFCVFWRHFENRNSDTLNWKELKDSVGTSFITLALCVAATLLNPYGVSLYESIFGLMGNSYFMNLNEEWLSPDFKAPEGVFFSYVLISVPLFAYLSGKLKATLFEVFSFIAAAFFALRSIR